MSRPKLSAPKRCSALGAARIAVEFCSSGSYGATTGANTASRITAVRTIVPATAPGLRQSRRTASCTKPLEPAVGVSDAGAPRGKRVPILVVSGWVSLIANPGIDEGIGEIDRQTRQHVDNRGHQNGPLNQRKIAVADGGDRDPSQPRSRKDLLGYHGAGEETGKLNTEIRHHRDQRVLKRVTHHDELLPDTFGPRRRHIVLPQYLQHRRAHEAGDEGS